MFNLYAGRYYYYDDDTNQIIGAHTFIDNTKVFESCRTSIKPFFLKNYALHIMKEELLLARFKDKIYGEFSG